MYSNQLPDNGFIINNYLLIFFSSQVPENSPSETNPHPGQSPISLSSPHPQQTMSSSQLHQPTALSVQSMEQLQLAQSTHSEASNNQLSLQGFPQS